MKGVIKWYMSDSSTGEFSYDISELENENFELSNNHKADYIKDFEAFKNRLFSDGIMTYELEVWLDDYMRWYNN